VGEPEDVVELSVDVLGLPLAVDGTDPLGDRLVVAATIGDRSLEPFAEWSDQRGPQQGGGVVERSGLTEPVPQRARVLGAELDRTGRRSADELVGDRGAVGRGVLVDDRGRDRRAR
jgi:hypothetical protein